MSHCTWLLFAAAILTAILIFAFWFEFEFQVKPKMQKYIGEGKTSKEAEVLARKEIEAENIAKEKIRFSKEVKIVSSDGEKLVAEHGSKMIELVFYRGEIVVEYSILFWRTHEWRNYRFTGGSYWMAPKKNVYIPDSKDLLIGLAELMSQRVSEGETRFTEADASKLEALSDLLDKKACRHASKTIRVYCTPPRDEYCLIARLSL